MRKAALVITAALVVAASVALASRGNAAPRPGLAQALEKTAAVSSQHYVFHVQIKRNGSPLALHIRGQSDARTISVHLSTQGMSGAEVLSGHFLYEEAPEGLVVSGQFRWLRTAVERLPQNSNALTVLRALTPAPLLDVIGRGHLHATGGGSVYVGSVPYDDPIVHEGLVKLTGGMEFRNLRLTVNVRDDLVRKILLTGRTADRSSTFKLNARLFAFGKPIHVAPPPPGTFMDDQLAELGA